MDNSSNNSILETINNNMEANPSTLNTSNDGGWLSSLYSISITTWIIIILILAFLGFNIFIYLAKGTNDITNFFTPIISKILGFFGMLTGQVVDSTATGAKAVTNTTAGAIDAGLTKIQNVAQGAEGNKASSSVGGTAIPNPDIMQNNTLNKALNNSNVQQNIGQSDDYEADDSTSSIQKSQSKGGYCYIGEERGYRSCMPVNENDACMSGEIFPTSEICINPSLRV
jgi:hypothetical protein